MRTTIELVTAVRDLYGSDRKAAPAFGVTQGTFSLWRNGDAFPTDDNAIKIAELLELDDAYVLAIVRHDRAPSDRARHAWERVASAFAKAAMLAVLSAAPFMAPDVQAARFNISNSALSLAQGASVIHIASHRRRRRWWEVLIGGRT